MADEFFDVGVKVNLRKFMASRAAVYATSGSGKSYLLRKIIEAIGNRVQQIVLDPEGEFASLREKFNFVLVAKDGEIPLSVKSVETLVRILYETNVSAVIDLYDLPPNERELFVHRFGQALLNMKKKLWHPLIVYLDEADKYAAEGENSECAKTIINLCGMGRKRGICTVLATLRIAELSKKALAQLLNKFIGRASVDVDQKRAGRELGWTNREDILGLRNLDVGEFYCFGPAISNEVQKFHVKRVVTSHPETGQMQVIPPTPKAIKAVLAKFADLPQEAEKDLATKEQQLREIQRLTMELKKANKLAKEVGADPQKHEVTQEKIATLTNQRDEAVAIAKLLQANYDSLHSQITKISALSNDALQRIDINIKMQPAVRKSPSHAAMPVPAARRPVNQQTEIKAAPKVIQDDSDEKDIGKGEMAILRGCAQYPDGVTRKQLSVLAGYKRSSRNIYINGLTRRGLMYQENDRLYATPMGITLLGDNYEPLPTGEALQEYWIRELPAGEKALLQILIEHYPKSVSREILTEKTGYKRSSRNIYINHLKAKEIVIEESGGLKASEYLFD